MHFLKPHGQPQIELEIAIVEHVVRREGGILAFEVWLSHSTYEFYDGSVSEVFHRFVED